MSLAPRARLGAYEIIALIGAGGMGEVYRARDMRLGRDVAIKVLPETFANDAERIARFQREAQVLASLSHPHIAAIHGLEEAGNIRALVLELVEGPTLADRIAEGPIPCDEAMAIAKQIADAVQAAHDHGVIHRDLKPANVKLKDGATVKVLDFGLAKALRTDAVSGQLSLSPTITSPAMMSGAGVILGTAAYMSPEQAKGKALDKRTDIWAFGCILFEMLTGTRAFNGEDVSDTMAAILRAEPDWNLLPKDLPEHMRLLIRRCLEKNRDKRIADLGVASFLMTETFPAAAPPAAMTPAPVPTRSWTRRLVPIVAVPVVASILGAASIWLLRPTSPPMVARFSYRLPEGQQFTTTVRRAVAISPDGTRVAYTANNRIHVKAMWDAEARPLPGTDIPQGVAVPTFSPDGRSIAFWSAADGTLKKVLIDGGAPVMLCAVESAPLGLDWAGDVLIFGQAGKGIMRVSANGGSPELIAALTTGELPVAAQILPDGRRFMYILAKATESETGQVVVQTFGSSERKIVMHGGFPRYVPTGHLLYHSRGVLLAVPFDVNALEIRGDPVAVVEGVRRGADGTGVTHFAISANGSLAYIPGPVSSASTPQLDVAWLDQKGSVESLRLPPRAYEVPRVSPDGRYLAVGTDDGKEADISVYDLSGSSSIRRLTFGGRSHFPVWSFDTTRVTFESDREGDRGIYWQRADGTGPAERLTKAEKDEIHIPYSWSVTGDTLLFASQRGPNQTLMTFSVRDNKTAQFGDVRSSAPVPINATFSPDGRWIAYARNEGNNRQALYVQPFPATGARYEISAGRNAMWSPDGKTLYFGTGPGPVLLAVKINTVPSFSFGAPTTLPRPGALLRQYAARNYDISRDGTRFAIVVAAGGAVSTASNEPRLEIVLNWFEELKQRVPTNN